MFFSMAIEMNVMGHFLPKTNECKSFLSINHVVYMLALVIWKLFELA